ncbi:unnamed protein product, partial [Rotaria socialis]
VTPDGGDHFTLKLNGQPVHSLGDQVTVHFKVQPNWYYNALKKNPQNNERLSLFF